MEEDEPGYSDALGVISALEKTCELEAKIRQAIQSTHPLTTTLDWDFHAADREREALLAISEQLEYLEDKLREYRHMESRELDNKAVVLSQLDNVRRELVQVTQNQQHNVTFGKEVVKEVLLFATLSDGGGAGSVCYDETGSYQSPPLRGVRQPPPYGRGSSGGRGHSSYASPPRREELSSPPSTLFSPGGTASRSTDPSGAASPYQKLNPLYAQQRRQYLLQLEAERQRQQGLSESEGAGAGGAYSRGGSRNSYSQGGGAGPEHFSGGSFSGGASSRPPAAPRRQINLEGPGEGRAGGDRAPGSRAAGGLSRGSEGWERVTSTSASYPPPAAASQREVYSFRRSAEGGLPSSAVEERAQPQGRAAALSSASAGYDSRQPQPQRSSASGAPRRGAADYDGDYEGDSSSRYRQQQQQLDPPAPARSDSRAAGSQKRQPSSAFASRVSGPSASSGSVRSGRDGLGDARGLGPGSRGRSREEERSSGNSGSRFLTTQRRRSPSPVSLRPEDIYGAVGGADSGLARPSASTTSGEPSAEYGGMVRIRDLLNKAETDLSKVAEERAARRTPHPPRIFGDDLSNRCNDGMEDVGADGGSSSTYSPTHSNRRYPLSVGTAVVGGGHCDRPAPRVIDREASHAPAASVAPCGNGWSGGSSSGGGGAGGFFGRLLLRLAGMAVAGAAAALGVAAVSSVMHHLGSRKAPSKAQPMQDMPPWLAAPPQPPPGAPQRSPSRNKRPPGSPQPGPPQQPGRKGDVPPWGYPGGAANGRGSTPPAPPLWGGGGSSAGAPNGAMPVLVTQSPVTHVQPLPEGDLFPSMPPPDVNVAKG